MINDLLYKEIIERMNACRKDIKYDTLGTEILLLALFDMEDTLTNLILKQLNITRDDLLNIINNSYYIRDDMSYSYALKNVFMIVEELEKKNEYLYDEGYLYALLENNNNVAIDILSKLKIEGKRIRDEIINALLYLQEDDRVLIDLTKKARNNELNKLIGRKEYINAVDVVLSRKQKNNCMLIGPAGVGKSGIVEGIAQYYLKTKSDITIYQLDLGSLISGTRYRGDLEEKLMDVLDSIKGENNILFIDEIHNILNNSTGENTMDIANLLKPFLARSKLKCIGATTVEEYHKTIAKDKALARRFKNIYVKEPTFIETINILKGIREDYESFYDIKYNDKIIEQIVIGGKYYHNLNNPDKAIDIMDECGIIAKKHNKKEVDIKSLKEVIFNGIGIDINKANYYLFKSNIDEKIKKEIKIYFNLKKQKYIFNQYINKDYKNEVIRELKKIFNLQSENILEIDMNDYTSEHSLSTLLGASPGYVGYEDGGVLTKQILRNNINILIFKNYDNINKVYKKFVDKIINDGYIIDYQGNKLNFINTMIFFIKADEKRIGF